MAEDMDSSLTNADLDDGATCFGGIYVALNEEEQAAVEGWRAANDIPSTEQAVRELVRLGLLSKIAESYDLVQSIRRTAE